MSDPYALLELPRGATRDQIRTAYRVKAMKLHPDRGGDAAAFSELQKAYQRLLRALPCETCEGKRYVTHRHGAFVQKTSCPTCQGTKT